MAYKKLDMSKLNFTSEPYIGNIPKEMSIPQSVLTGENKMVIYDAKPIKGEPRMEVSVKYV